VGFPTLRLIRAAIGLYTLEQLAPGCSREHDWAQPAPLRAQAA
jgi:16S rRNA U516 pseudouridylate synthase RsuA-like enzyme